MGKAGKVLHVLATVAGIDLSEVYLANATRCWGKRNPKNSEVDACHDYLIQDLQEVQPQVIIALGLPAVRSLYKQSTMKSIAGFTLFNDNLPGIPIIPTFHPSFLMRGNWSDTAQVLTHFRKAWRIAKEGMDYRMGSYTGITTLEQLRGLRDYILGGDVSLLSVDTETCGLSWMDDELLCISLTPEEGVGYSVPIMHRGTRTVTVKKKKKDVEVEEFFPTPFWSEEEFPETLALLNDILSSDIPKCGQNFGFDIRFLEREDSEEAVNVVTALGLKVNNFQHDTKMASRLLQETVPANLTTLNANWTDIPFYESSVKDLKSKMWEVKDEDLWVYGATDTDVTQRVLPQLLEGLESEGSLWIYNNISIPLVRAATEMERRGVLVGTEYFDRLCSYYTKEVGEKKEAINKVLGRTLEKPTYYLTLQKLLFEELKLPLTNASTPSSYKGGKVSERCKNCKKTTPCSPKHAATGGDELEELYERTQHPILPPLISLKSVEKMKSTYLDGSDGTGGFKRHIRNDNRIHSRWQAGGAETGRFTSQDPNMMNPPKGIKIDNDEYDIHTKDAIRSMFVAPEGYSVGNIDWAQMEVWVLAYETQDPTLLELLNSGKDVHTHTARTLCALGISSVFPLSSADPELSDEEWREKHEDLRDGSKTFTFGIMYQLTEAGAAARLNCSEEESGRLFQAFLGEVFPTLQDYFSTVREKILRDFGVQNIFGRWRHFPEVPVLLGLGQGYQNHLEGVIRQGVNFPIQSGAHDLHSLAHINHERDEVLSVRASIVSEMHDSVAFYGVTEELEEIARLTKTTWEAVAKDTVLQDGNKLGWEIPVEVKYGRSFGDLDYTLTADGKLLTPAA